MLEIPSDAEINDNILAYWRPKAPMAAGSEVALAYRQYWCWTPPDRPPLATVASDPGQARLPQGGAAFVDFSGEMLGDNPPPDLQADHLRWSWVHS